MRVRAKEQGVAKEIEETLRLLANVALFDASMHIHAENELQGGSIHANYSQLRFLRTRTLVAKNYKRTRSYYSVLCSIFLICIYV